MIPVPYGGYDGKTTCCSVCPDKTEQQEMGTNSDGKKRRRVDLEILGPTNREGETQCKVQK